MIIEIDGYLNVTREFDCVPDGYVVLYSDSAMDYEVLNTRDEFFELYTDDYNDVVEYFNQLHTVI